MNSKNLKNDPKILIQMAKEGDSTAFGGLYELYFTPVYRYFYFRTRSREEAEDLTQIVFLKVFQAVSSFKEKGKNPLAFFMTVARNVLIDHWRKKKDVVLENDHDIFTKIPDTSKSVREKAEQSDFSREISVTLENLTEDQREIIALKFFSELENKEISEITGKTEEAIRQMQVRALKALKENLKDFIN